MRISQSRQWIQTINIWCWAITKEFLYPYGEEYDGRLDRLEPLAEKYLNALFALALNGFSAVAVIGVSFLAPLKDVPNAPRWLVSLVILINFLWCAYAVYQLKRRHYREWKQRQSIQTWQMQLSNCDGELPFVWPVLPLHMLATFCLLVLVPTALVLWALKYSFA